MMCQQLQPYFWSTQFHTLTTHTQLQLQTLATLLRALHAEFTTDCHHVLLLLVIASCFSLEVTNGPDYITLYLALVA